MIVVIIVRISLVVRLGQSRHRLDSVSMQVCVCERDAEDDGENTETFNLPFNQ